MTDAAYEKIAKRHANCPREAFEALRTVAEWQADLERVPIGEPVEVGGQLWQAYVPNGWVPVSRFGTADLALWAHLKAQEVLEVGQDVPAAPEAGSGREAGHS